MSYTENYQKWLDFAELPAYLRDELVAMDEKTKEWFSFYNGKEIILPDKFLPVQLPCPSL